MAAALAQSLLAQLKGVVTSDAGKARDLIAKIKASGLPSAFQGRPACLRPHHAACAATLRPRQIAVTEFSDPPTPAEAAVARE
jgi:hypothetical protein